MSLKLEFPSSMILPPAHQAKMPFYTLTAMTSDDLTETYKVTKIIECLSNRSNGMKRLYRATMVVASSGIAEDFIFK